MATGKGNKLLGVIIVIAIIVIVLAIVIPTWHSRQAHKHLNTALDAASGAKLVVEETATVKGLPPADLGDDLPFDGSHIDSPYVKEVRILDGGRIQVTTQNTGAKPAPVLMLTPTEASDGVSILWQCTITDGATSPSPDGCAAKVEPADATSVAPSEAASAHEAAPAGSVD